MYGTEQLKVSCACFFRMKNLRSSCWSGITKGALLPSKSLSLQETHLVRCLTYISHRYFAPERIVVISSPSTYRDLQHELTSENQRTALWPVVVTVDGNISQNEETDYIDRDGSYIILTPDGNIWKLSIELSSLLFDRGNKYKNLWNFEARFVVAGTSEFSLMQKKNLLHFFSNFRIYNCIIVSQEHYVISKELSRTINVNGVDRDMKLDVYTWFPYQSSESCTEVNDITLLDSWVFLHKSISPSILTCFQ
jgi:hypothetical protein